MPEPDGLPHIDELINEASEGTASLSKTTLAWEERLGQVEAQNRELKSKIDVQGSELKLTQTIAGLVILVALSLAGSAFLGIQGLRKDLASSRERLAVIETIHSEQYFRPVHIHAAEQSQESVVEAATP